jgi:hypothetical protein
MSKKLRKHRSLASIADVRKWCLVFARENNLNADRLGELIDIVSNAFMSSKAGRLPIPKATSLAANALGVGLDGADLGVGQGIRYSELGLNIQ